MTVLGSQTFILEIGTWYFWMFALHLYSICNSFQSEIVLSFLSKFLKVYYIVCVCVCVWEREKEREWTWACSTCRNGRQREDSCPAWVLCLWIGHSTKMTGALSAGPSRWLEGSCYIAFDLSIIFVRDLLWLICWGSLYNDKSRKVHTPFCSNYSRKCVPCDQILIVTEESKSQREDLELCY